MIEKYLKNEKRKPPKNQRFQSGWEDGAKRRGKRWVMVRRMVGLINGTESMLKWWPLRL